jgi:hypothetical protein
VPYKRVLVGHNWCCGLFSCGRGMIPLLYISPEEQWYEGCAHNQLYSPPQADPSGYPEQWDCTAGGQVLNRTTLGLKRKPIFFIFAKSEK